jgi:hypothetical protein
MCGGRGTNKPGCNKTEKAGGIRMVDDYFAKKLMDLRVTD